MLSSTALRLGNYGRIALSRVNTNVLAVRSAASATSENPIKKAHELYNSPDRDLANFPDPVQPETCPPVRMGFIPDSWFQAFYNKTGVTGPYLFGVGLTATLLSKEIWVVDHGFTEVLAFATAVTLVIKKAGPAIAKYIDEQNQRREDILYHQPLKAAKAADEAFIKDAQATIDCQDGQKYLFQAKKENVDLQLEAIYRQRQQEVYKAVKNRLDHQLDTQNAKIRFEQEHMVKWIVDNVVKSITPQQETDSIKKCISDLKLMQARA